jgi:hypothetical protein
MENNNIRENIIKYFKNRECFTLPRPVDSEKDLNQLDKIPFEQLKSNFKLEFINLRNKVYKESNAKVINGKKMTGTVLANLIEEFIIAINKGSVPNINNAWDSVIKQDIQEYYNKAIEKYKINVKVIKEIYEQELLTKMLLDTKMESLLIYDKFLNLNSETFTNDRYYQWYHTNRDRLEEEMNKIQNKLLSENIEKSKRYSQEIAKKEYKDITNNLFKNFYNVENIAQLLNDLFMYKNII